VVGAIRFIWYDDVEDVLSDTVEIDRIGNVKRASVFFLLLLFHLACFF